MSCSLLFFEMTAEISEIITWETFLQRTEPVKRSLFSDGELLKQRLWKTKPVNKQQVWISKITVLYVHRLLLYISLPSSHNFDMKLPNFLFYVKRELKYDFSFSFSNFRNRSLEFNSRKNLSTFGKSERAGIVVTSTNVHPTV